MLISSLLRQQAESIIAQREGSVSHVYLDSLGIPTGGTGHRILPEDHMRVGDPILPAVAAAWLDKDIDWALTAAVKQASEAAITDEKFIPWLASVNFQLGPQWTTKWPNTWHMIVEGHYEAAANALDGTPWQHQSPIRVNDFQDALIALPQKLGS